MKFNFNDPVKVIGGFHTGRMGHIVDFYERKHWLRFFSKKWAYMVEFPRKEDKEAQSHPFFLPRPDRELIYEEHLVRGEEISGVVKAIPNVITTNSEGKEI